MKDTELKDSYGTPIKTSLADLFYESSNHQYDSYHPNYEPPPDSSLSRVSYNDLSSEGSEPESAVLHKSDESTKKQRHNFSLPVMSDKLSAYLKYHRSTSTTTPQPSSEGGSFKPPKETFNFLPSNHKPNREPVSANQNEDTEPWPYETQQGDQNYPQQYASELNNNFEIRRHSVDDENDKNEYGRSEKLSTSSSKHARDDSIKRETSNHKYDIDKNDEHEDWRASRNSKAKSQ